MRITQLFAIAGVVLLLFVPFRIPQAISIVDTYMFENVVDPPKSRKDTIQVSAMMYQPTEAQNDASPLKTADGSRIPNPQTASSLKWIAVSQDLLKRNGGYFQYGDSVELVIPQNPSKSGIYVVHDCMNPRVKKTIDILESIGTKPYRYSQISINFSKQ